MMRAFMSVRFQQHSHIHVRLGSNNRYNIIIDQLDIPYSHKKIISTNFRHFR